MLLHDSPSYLNPVPSSCRRGRNSRLPIFFHSAASHLGAFSRSFFSAKDRLCFFLCKAVQPPPPFQLVRAFFPWFIPLEAPSLPSFLLFHLRQPISASVLFTAMSRVASLTNWSSSPGSSRFSSCPRQPFPFFVSESSLG